MPSAQTMQAAYEACAHAMLRGAWECDQRGEVGSSDVLLVEHARCVAAIAALKSLDSGPSGV